MKEILIYHNPVWGKSRESVKILKELCLDYKIIEYLKEPLVKEQIKQLSKLLNLPPKDFTRKNDKLIKDKINDLDSDSIIDEMIKSPRIIERPIVVWNNKAIIARPPEKIYKFLS